MGINGATQQKLWRSEKRTAVVRGLPSIPRRRFRDLVELADAVLWEADPRTLQLSFITGRAEQLFGYPLERWLSRGDLLREIVLEDDVEALQHRADGIAENGCTVEYRVRTADERVLWIREAIRVTRDPRGQRSGIHGAMVDISELRQAEQVSLRLQTMLDANAKASRPDEPETIDEAARPRFQQTLASGLDELLDPRLTARRVARALGEALRLGLVAVYDTHASTLLALWPEEVARREHSGPCELAARLGSIDPAVPFVPVPERCAHVPSDIQALGAMPLVDGQGELIGAIAIGAQDRPWFDDTFRVELRWFALQMGKALSVALASERLAASAARDTLTGLLRRDDFYLRFGQELSRAVRTDTRLALLRWDFVEFAEFNARHGRRTGDRALRAFADAVRAELRTYDVAGRIGGDDMAALLFVNRHQEAHIAAARIQKRAAITRVGDLFIPFPARGYALFPDDGGDVATLDRVSLVRLGNHREARLSFIRKDESMSIIALPDASAAAAD